MSLINDALKRAKETHGEAPPPTPPPEKTGLRPVEAAPRKGTPVWLWLLVIFILVGLGMFFIGQSTHKTVAASSNPSTGTVPQPAKAAPPETKPLTIAQAPVPATQPAATTPEASAPGVPGPAPTVGDATPAAAPVSFKLQSIIYDPRRPSAMVNGKLLFVGDRISGFHVVAIQKDSITLVGNGQTNELELQN